MKFATPFKNNFQIVPDEYDIEFTTYSNYDNLIDFLSSHKDDVVNIIFNEDINTEKLALINKLFDNFRIKLNPKDLSILEFLKENNIKFIFNNTIPINSYSLLN